MDLNTHIKNATFVSLFDISSIKSSQKTEILNSQKNSQKVKQLGQVFTPPFVVDLMLDLPQNTKLCGRKILEAGCGDGAFLTRIIRR